MAKDTRNLPAFLSNDADFRAWGSGIAAQIAAMGLVQTADTGQINWTTVARPAINTSAGYEMWRFADSLQATKPVFIRLDYGVAGAVDRPRIIARVGTATDGAGTLTGQVGTAVTAMANTSKTAGVVQPSLCSGSTSRLNLFTGVEIAGAAAIWGTMIWVERSKTSAGVDTGDGVMTWVSSWNSSAYQAIPFAGTIPASQTSNPAISISAASGAISSVGPNVAVSPTVGALGKPCFASWVAYISADIPKLVPVSIDHMGATRTLLPLGDTAYPFGNFVQGTTTGHSLAMLWE
jgi:hypothetical protein